MNLTSFALPFLFACASCLAAGLLLWGLLAAASRYWLVLAGNRSVWLLAQVAVTAIFVLALLPQRAQYRAVPVVDLGAIPALMQQPAASVAAQNALADDADADVHDGAWLALAAQAWLAVYGAGLLWSVTRYCMARRNLHGLLAGCRQLDTAALASHAGFTQALPAGLKVLETPAAISPMLIGWRHPRLLLPAHLRSFPVEQQGLIVAHEITHWKRRDPALLYASLLVQTVFWFNPVLRLLGARLQWAQELGCDREVLAGRPPQQRQHYAAALVAQLKAQQAGLNMHGGAMAFGATDGASMVARIGLIRHDCLRRLGVAGKAAVTVSMALLLGAAAVLQPALAWNRVPPSAPVDGPAAPLAVQGWTAPLEQQRVTSFYGAPRKSGRPHRGIDFAARKGTPVLAVADGVVLESTDLYGAEPIYGKVVVVQHANGLRSFYAHLDQRKVTVGAAIKAGQVLGLAGDTGRTTGPHLHLEAFDGSQRIDPQRLLPSLDAHATGTALRLRPASSVR